MGLNPNLMDDIQIERTTLKDQTTNILRNLIVSGKIRPGAKITERDIAEMLNISRMPARDALMELERQGLVVSKPGGRFVIQLNETEIRHLYQVRQALENLAVELAADNITEASKHELQTKLTRLQSAVSRGDQEEYVASDLDIHETIWGIAGNPYLENLLHSMIGPIFMFISSQTKVELDWQETLTLHETLVGEICAHQKAKALEHISTHMQVSLDLALTAFQNR